MYGGEQSRLFASHSNSILYKQVPLYSIVHTTTLYLFIASRLSYYTLEDKIMADPVWNVAFLEDAVNELRNQVHDLQWELGGVRSRMLREIRTLRRALLLPVEDQLAGNDDADNDNNNQTIIFLLVYYMHFYLFDKQIMFDL